MNRPVSINVIALWLFLGAVLDLRAVVFYPFRTLLLTVLGVHLVRYAAICAYFAFLQIRVFLGVGLLGRKAWARTGSIVFCLYGVVNPILTFVMPGSFERFLLAEERMFPGADFSGLAMTILRAGHVLSLVAGVGVSLVALYFLWTRREAFARPQIASGAEGASNEGGAA